MMDRKRIAIGSLLVGLAVWAAAALPAARPALAADDGITTGVEFVVPIQLGGKTYQGRAILAPDGTMRVTVVLVYQVKRDTQPDPDPKPPVPPPVPTPGKAAWLYLIHETGDDTVALAAIRDNKAWKDEADRLGMKWLVIDKDEARKGLPEVTTAAIKKGLPAVVGLTTNKVVCLTESCPAKPADMLALIKRAGGLR